MGIFKDAKAKVAGDHARRSAEEGHAVLVFLINVPRTTPEGTPVSGVAEQIESVEAEGWRLQSLSAKDAGSMIALFRRAAEQEPAP
jgi:hypothetical protein